MQSQVVDHPKSRAFATAWTTSPSFAPRQKQHGPEQRWEECTFVQHSWGLQESTWGAEPKKCERTELIP